MFYAPIFGHTFSSNQPEIWIVFCDNICLEISYSMFYVWKWKSKSNKPQTYSIHHWHITFAATYRISNLRAHTNIYDISDRFKLTIDQWISRNVAANIAHAINQKYFTLINHLIEGYFFNHLIEAYFNHLGGGKIMSDFN